MGLPLGLDIAAQHLLHRRRQTMVSLLGVALGVGFFIGISAMMQGFQRDFVARIIDVQPHIIVKVRRADGKQLYQRKGSSFGRVIEPQYVGMMNAMMQETLLTGTARKAELPGWHAAGKTGTSQEFRDAWFVGYTSYLVTAVWLGNDDDSPTKKVSGGNLPVEVWSRFMKAAHEGVTPAPLPLGIWQPGLPNPFAPLLAPFTGGSAAAPPPHPPASTTNAGSAPRK